MKKQVAGIIGCGYISQFHFSGFEKADVKVAWACDLNEALGKQWAAKSGARYTADYKEIIADPEVTIVDVCVSSPVHKEICLAAIAAGKAVICEKTLATNPDDALDIVTAAEKAGVVFYTSYMKRFIPAVQKAKELLPKLGQITSTYIRAYQCWGDSFWKPEPPEGFFKGAIRKNGISPVRKSYGGGLLVCGGSHILDLVCHLVGRPQRLYASMLTPQGLDIDVRASALMETPSNGVVHFEVLGHSMRRIGFLRDGWDERVEINGVNGRLEIYSSQWDDPYHKASLLIHTDNTADSAMQYTFDAVSPFDRAIAFFCANIAEGKQGAQGRETGYDVDELIAHIVRSAEMKQAVDMKWRI